MSDTQSQETEAAGPEIKPRLEREIEKMGIAELSALRDAVELRRLGLVENAKQEALSEFEEKLRLIGLTLEEALPRSLFTFPSRPGEAGSEGRRGERKAGPGSSPFPPEYRGPNGETWSGRGRMAKWLAALEATGRNREEFRV